MSLLDIFSSYSESDYRPPPKKTGFLKKDIEFLKSSVGNLASFGGKNLKQSAFDIGKFKDGSKKVTGEVNAPSGLVDASDVSDISDTELQSLFDIFEARQAEIETRRFQPGITQTRLVK